MMWPWGQRPDPVEQVAESRESRAILTALLAQLEDRVADLKEVTVKLEAAAAMHERRGNAD